MTARQPLEHNAVNVSQIARDTYSDNGGLLTPVYEYLAPMLTDGFHRRDSAFLRGLAEAFRWLGGEYAGFCVRAANEIDAGRLPPDPALASGSNESGCLSHDPSTVSAIARHLYDLQSSADASYEYLSAVALDARARGDAVALQTLAADFLWLSDISPRWHDDARRFADMVEQNANEIANEVSAIEERTPLAIIQDRYAKGEVSRAEYLQARDDLDTKAGTQSAAADVFSAVTLEPGLAVAVAFPAGARVNGSDFLALTEAKTSAKRWISDRNNGVDAAAAAVLLLNVLVLQQVAGMEIVRLGPSVFMSQTEEASFRKWLMKTEAEIVPEGHVATRLQNALNQGDSAKAIRRAEERGARLFQQMGHLRSENLEFIRSWTDPSMARR